MSLHLVLREQIDRSNKSIAAYEKKLEKLPRGSIHEKHRGEKKYYYLKYRDSNGKRVDSYIKVSELPEVEKKLKKRKQYEAMIKSLQEDIKIARKGLR